MSAARTETEDRVPTTLPMCHSILGVPMRRRLLGLLCAVALPALAMVAACGPAPREVAQEAPVAVHPLLPDQAGLNVIVVSFDALRADALGAYGNRRDVTPHIDRFARRNLLFQNAYTVAPVTPTSFSAAWSGFLPHRVFQGWKFQAPETLASLLSEAGYRTQAFVSNVNLTPERSFDRGFQGYDWRPHAPDDQLLDAAVQWIGNHPDPPFFLWVHLLAPHAPYRVHPEVEGLYETEATGRFAKTSGPRFETTDPAEIARLRDLYHGEVWRADRLFASLMESVRSAGLLESSIVVLTSDHGEEFGEHGAFQHGQLYEDNLRIPLIIHHPALEGRVVEQRVRNIDLLPTILRAVGSPVAGERDGRVIPESGTGEPPPVVAIAMTGQEKASVSLLQGSKKLILWCHKKPGVEEFDLATDPEELRGPAVESRAESRKLLKRVATLVGGRPCRVILRAAKGKSSTDGLAAKSIEVLRSLGYVE